MFNFRLLAVISVAVAALTVPTTVEAENLTEAWSIALSVDQSLEASQWRASAAQRGLKAAQAERWASLDAQAKYYVYDKPLAINVPLPVGPSPAQFDLTQREGLIAGVHVSQPLYTGGRITHGIEAAGAQVTAAVSSQEKTQLDVMQQVGIAYANVLHAQRGVEVTVQAVESLTAHARDVQNRLDQGVGIPNNLLAVQVALADSKQRRLQAEATLDVARAAYNRTLLRALDTPVSLDELEPPAGGYDLEMLTHQALTYRPEIAQLNATVRALRSQAAAVRGGCLPQIAVQGGFEFVENEFFADEAFSMAAVVGQWNVWDMGRKRHTAMKHEQNAEALLRQRSDVETKIVLQVRDAWRRLETTLQRIQVNRAAIESAEENLKVSRNRYVQGAGTNTEVLDAETLRTATYSNYYGSVYDSVRAMMNLSRAVGDFNLAYGDVQVAPPEEEAVAPVVPPPVPMPEP